MQNIASISVLRYVYPLNCSGRVLEAIGMVIFLLLLILMAKGFTITRGRISTSGVVKLGLFMVVYAVVYSVLFFYEADVSRILLLIYELSNREHE